MNVTRKDATITNVGPVDDFPGSFEVVLSTPAKDRDGDELATEDWKQPLPEHITFDIDHGMSVEKTVGSGVPSIDPAGRLVVSGTYSSLAKAQDTRTLVNEGHIRTVSVAFMSEKESKGGKTRTVRELLNGAFVAIPSNRESLVLASKGLGVKAGARNSAMDQKHMQTAHDELVAAGARCGPEDSTGAAEGSAGGKGVDQLIESIDAATKKPVEVRLDGKVLTTAVVKGNAAATKAADPDDNPGALAQAVDAALDEAQNLISQVDPSTLPEPIQQALGLITAAEQAVDELLDALGVPDPDETETDTGDAPTAEKQVDEQGLELKYRAIRLAALAG